jgi:hypothetical protein
VREKYFSLRPKPLERWLWKQNLSPAAERVFWLHWEEGMRNRSWCSEVPIRTVAAQCCVDISTVTRAYQSLRSLDLIRREDPGRDPHNPFQQATSITEVRIPRGLLAELETHPNRRRGRPSLQTEQGACQPPLAPPTVERAPAEAPRPSMKTLSRHEAGALWARASTAERARFLAASAARSVAMDFDPNTRLSPEDRGYLLDQLIQMAHAPNAANRATTPTGFVEPSKPGPNRPLSPLELARTRRKLLSAIPATEVVGTLRQIAWAVEQGALQRFDRTMALNIALKKIREGSWTRPHRMPPNWWPSARIAEPELCSAA